MNIDLSMAHGAYNMIFECHSPLPSDYALLNSRLHRSVASSGGID